MTGPKKPVRNFLTNELLSCPLQDLQFTDPVRAADAAAQLSGLGVEAEIRSYVLITATLDALKGDDAASDKFRQALVEEKILTQSEIDLGSSSPKLSNLRAIAATASVFLKPEAKPYIPSGFRAQYALAKLYKELKAADDDDRFKQFLAKCERMGGKLTIAVIEEERDSQKKKPAPVGLPAPHNAEREDIAIGDQFDLFLFTPSEEDFKRAKSDDRAEAANCMALHAADRACAYLICSASRITFFHRKLLRDAGFGDISGVRLLSQPQHADISDVMVIATAYRGGHAAEVSPEWLQDTDFRRVTEEEAPWAKKKIHVFAADQSRDWTCLVGETNWTLRNA